MKILKILLFNIVIFAGMIASVELSLNIAKYIKYKIKNSESITKTNQTGTPIPITWDQGFHLV